MSSSSSSHTAQSAAQVTPTQVLVKELIEMCKQLMGKIDVVLTRQELTNFKLELMCTEVEDDGQDDYEMEMEEPNTPKRMKYTPKK